MIFVKVDLAISDESEFRPYRLSHFGVVLPLIAEQFSSHRLAVEKMLYARKQIHFKSNHCVICRLPSTNSQIRTINFESTCYWESKNDHIWPCSHDPWIWYDILKKCSCGCRKSRMSLNSGLIAWSDTHFEVTYRKLVGMFGWSVGCWWCLFWWHCQLNLPIRISSGWSEFVRCRAPFFFIYIWRFPTDLFLLKFMINAMILKLYFIFRSWIGCSSCSVFWGL